MQTRKTMQENTIIMEKKCFFLLSIDGTGMEIEMVLNEKSGRKPIENECK